MTDEQKFIIPRSRESIKCKQWIRNFGCNRVFGPLCKRIADFAAIPFGEIVQWKSKQLILKRKGIYDAISWNKSQIDCVYLLATAFHQGGQKCILSNKWPEKSRTTALSLWAATEAFLCPGICIDYITDKTSTMLWARTVIIALTRQKGTVIKVLNNEQIVFTTNNGISTSAIHFGVGYASMRGLMKNLTIADLPDRCFCLTVDKLCSRCAYKGPLFGITRTPD